MARNNMLTVDGVKIPTPSVLTWVKQDISASDAERTDDTIMHKNKVGEKVTLKAQWNGKRPADVSKVLKAFAPEYVKVNYPDPEENKNLTKTFYTGDKTAVYSCWTVNNKLYESVSFDLIER